MRSLILENKVLSKLRDFSEEKYGDAAWAYGHPLWIIRSVYANRLSALLNILPVDPQLRVVEIGSGSGLLTISLKRYYETVIGSDVHRQLTTAKTIMKEAGENPELVRCDTRRLPFANQSISLFVGSSVLEHLDPNDLPAALGEIYNALSPQGYLALGYPIESFPVRLFFKSIGFDPSKHHPSKADVIRKSCFEAFGKPSRVRKLPRENFPDALSYYEIVLFQKSP